jgi:hypothetical protein
MKVVYLDHHIVVNEAGWPAIKSLSDSGEIRVVVSSWTIREIAQGMREREERMAFLESLLPLYIHDMQVLQRLETTSFLNSFLFGGQPIPFAMFTETFADFLQMNFQIKTRLDYSLTDYIRAEGDTSGDAVDLGKEEHAQAMRTLLADPDGVRRVEEQTNHATMATLIPRRNFRGRAWEPSEIADMLVYCHNHRHELLRASPAIIAEDALSRARLIDPTRKPRTSDTADLFHSVSALAYADIFVTGDGWARDRVQLANRTMERQGFKGCTVVRSLDELQLQLRELKI